MYFSGKFKAETIHLSLEENTTFFHQVSIHRSQNGVFLQFQSCVKTILGHTVPCHEKKGQGRVFFGFRMPFLLWLRLGETVLSDDFPSRSGKQPDFQKTQQLDKSYCCTKDKWISMFFSQVEAGIIQLPQVKSIAFTIITQLPGSQKPISWLFQSCKDTLRTPIPFHEKRCQGRVFCEYWLLYLLLPWIGETLLSDDFPARSGKHLFLSDNWKTWTKLLLQWREKWTSVFLWQF